MGILETINAKLNAIALKMGVDFSNLEPAGVFSLPPSAPAQVTGMIAIDLDDEDEAAPATVTAPAAGVARIKLKDAVAQNLPITGNEIDEQGCYFDKTINTENPAYTQKFIWKKGRGVDEQAYKLGIARIQAEVAAAAPKSAPAAAAPVVTQEQKTVDAAAAVSASLPPVGGLPTGHVATNPAVLNETDTLRKEALTLINTLVKKYSVDIETIDALLVQHGSSNGKFDGLPESSYPLVSKKLNQWMIGLDHIEAASNEILALCAGDKSYVFNVYDSAAVGTRNVGEVSFNDLRKLYEALHGYLNLLEDHFKRVRTSQQANPFV